MTIAAPEGPNRTTQSFAILNLAAPRRRRGAVVLCDAKQARTITVDGKGTERTLLVIVRGTRRDDSLVRPASSVLRGLARAPGFSVSTDARPWTQRSGGWVGDPPRIRIFVLSNGGSIRFDFCSDILPGRKATRTRPAGRLPVASFPASGRLSVHDIGPSRPQSPCFGP